jgi:hypothetical protein
MASSVAEGSSQFWRTEVSLSIFGVPKAGLFVKRLQGMCSEMVF